MIKDPKFGWHILWVGPLFFISSAIYKMLDIFNRPKKKKHTPELDRLRKLSGIKPD